VLTFSACTFAGCSAGFHWPPFDSRRSDSKLHASMRAIVLEPFGTKNLFWNCPCLS
jgi:hypothetical protein